MYGISQRIDGIPKVKKSCRWYMFGEELRVGLCDWAVCIYMAAVSSVIALFGAEEPSWMRTR